MLQGLTKEHLELKLATCMRPDVIYQLIECSFISVIDTWIAHENISCAKTLQPKSKQRLDFRKVRTSPEGKKGGRSELSANVKTVSGTTSFTANAAHQKSKASESEHECTATAAFEDEQSLTSLVSPQDAHKSPKTV